MTLSRVANVRGYSTSTETIEKSSRFFGCQLGDVAQYVEDVALIPEPPRGAGDKPAKRSSVPVEKPATTRKKP